MTKSGTSVEEEDTLAVDIVDEKFLSEWRRRGHSKFDAGLRYERRLT